MTLVARRCPVCGGQVEVVSAGTAWHRSDCPNLDRSLFAVEEIEVVPAEILEALRDAAGVLTSPELKDQWARVRARAIIEVALERFGGTG
jgi:hypothetical protein